MQPGRLFPSLVGRVSQFSRYGGADVGNPVSLPRLGADWPGCGGGRRAGRAGRAGVRGGECKRGELESARRVRRNIFMVSEFLFLFILLVLFFFLDFFMFWGTNSPIRW